RRHTRFSRDWSSDVCSSDLSLQTPDVSEALLERIQLGLLQEKQLRCRYYAAHQDKERELVLNPLALVQRGSITYLIATAVPHARSEERRVGKEWRSRGAPDR